MKKTWYAWFALVLVVFLLLMANSAQACPNCFASSDKRVLHTYYASALFLSLLPFGIVGFILAWFYFSKRQTSSKKRFQSRQSRTALPPPRR